MNQPKKKNISKHLLQKKLMFHFFFQLKKCGFTIIHYTNSSWLPCFHTLISFHFFSLFNKHPNFQTHTPQPIALPLIFPVFVFPFKHTTTNLYISTNTHMKLYFKSHYHRPYIHILVWISEKLNSKPTNEIHGQPPTFTFICFFKSNKTKSKNTNLACGYPISQLCHFSFRSSLCVLLPRKESSNQPMRPPKAPPRNVFSMSIIFF